MNDAIVISDIHIGSVVCQSQLLIDFLRQIKQGTIPASKLIINGDLFESFDSRLTKSQWKVLSLIRKLSDQMETILISGNHDRLAPVESVAHILGCQFYPDKYIFQSGDKKILVLHGDVFDKFLTDHPFLTWASDLIYWLLQKIDPSCYFVKLAKHSSKTYLRCSEVVRDGALRMLEVEGCDLAVCSHTHNAKASGKYFNTGSWTELPCSYLAIKDGKVELKSIKP